MHTLALTAQAQFRASTVWGTKSALFFGMESCIDNSPITKASTEKDSQKKTTRKRQADRNTATEFPFEPLRRLPWVAMRLRSILCSTQCLSLFQIPARVSAVYPLGRF